MENKSESEKKSRAVFSPSIWFIGFLFTLGYVPIGTYQFEKWWDGITYIIFTYFAWPLMLGAQLSKLSGG